MFVRLILLVLSLVVCSLSPSRAGIRSLEEHVTDDFAEQFFVPPDTRWSLWTFDLVKGSSLTSYEDRHASARLEDGKRAGYAFCGYKLFDTSLNNDAAIVVGGIDRYGATLALSVRAYPQRGRSWAQGKIRLRWVKINPNNTNFSCEEFGYSMQPTTIIRGAPFRPPAPVSPHPGDAGGDPSCYCGPSGFWICKGAPAGVCVH